MLGIEPSSNVADVAKSKGIDTWVTFFTTKTARESWSQKGEKPTSFWATMCLAHVPALNDFVAVSKLFWPMMA